MNIFWNVLQWCCRLLWDIVLSALQAHSFNLYIHKSSNCWCWKVNNGGLYLLCFIKFWSMIFNVWFATLSPGMGTCFSVSYCPAKCLWKIKTRHEGVGYTLLMSADGWQDQLSQQVCERECLNLPSPQVVHSHTQTSTHFKTVSVRASSLRGHCAWTLLSMCLIQYT